MPAFSLYPFSSFSISFSLSFCLSSLSPPLFSPYFLVPCPPFLFIYCLNARAVTVICNDICVISSKTESGSLTIRVSFRFNLDQICRPEGLNCHCHCKELSARNSLCGVGEGVVGRDLRQDSCLGGRAGLLGRHRRP